eukprot:31870_1
MSSRPSPQSEISSSIGSAGQNNINCNETKEEPFLSTITNPLAAGSTHARNEVYNDMRKGEVANEVEEDMLYQIHCLATPPKGSSVEIPIHSSPTNTLSGGKLSAEQEYAAEEAKSKLHRMTKVEAMVNKRMSCFSYMKKILAGNVFWLNCVLLKRDDLELYTRKQDQPRQHVLKLYYLGISLAHVLQQVSGAGSLVRSVLQLMEEWEYHFSSGTNQSIRGMMAKNTEQLFLSGESTKLNREFPDEPIIPKLRKLCNVVIYGFLLTPCVPIELDYFEVMLSLCDIIWYVRLWANTEWLFILFVHSYYNIAWNEVSGVKAGLLTNLVVIFIQVP